MLAPNSIAALWRNPADRCEYLAAVSGHGDCEVASVDDVWHVIVNDVPYPAPYLDAVLEDLPPLMASASRAHKVNPKSILKGAKLKAVLHTAFTELS